MLKLYSLCSFIPERRTVSQAVDGRLSTIESVYLSSGESEREVRALATDECTSWVSESLALGIGMALVAADVEILGSSLA